MIYKKIISVLILALCLCFTSCKKDESKEGILVGSWLITEGCVLGSNGQTSNCTAINYTPCTNEPADGNYYIFSSDGKIRSNFATCTGAGIYNCTDYEEGTWEVNDETISIVLTGEYDCSTDEIETINSPGTLTIVSCENDKLVVNDENDPNDKIQITFTRQ